MTPPPKIAMRLECGDTEAPDAGHTPMKRAVALLIGVVLFGFSARAPADYAAGAAYYVKKDYERAFTTLLPAAQEGEAQAQFTLGVMYDLGQHVAADKEAAFGWYRQAADQGHPQAQLRLSGMLFAGEGVAPDRPEAFKWALLAIDRIPVKKRDGARAFSTQIRQLLDDRQAARAEAEAAAWQPRLPAPAHNGAEPRLIKTGTGVFLNERGALLTDLHVAWPCRNLLVSYGDAVNRATILTFDIALDLAVLDTPFRGVETAVFAAAPALSVGDAVSIIGYAPKETRSRTPISAHGTVTALADIAGNEDFFWTSAPGMRGQSGGPVIDEHGLVVGLVKATPRTQTSPIGDTPTQNRSLAIAGNRIARFLERLKIELRRSPANGASNEPRPNVSPAETIGLVECWG